MTAERTPKPRRGDLARGRQKAPAVEPRVRAARTYEIARMMASGTWNARASHQALAKDWGLAVPTVRLMAAEASRLVDLVTGQRAALVEVSRIRLFEVLQQDEPDRVAAARVLLESLGELRQRNIVSEEKDPMTSWTDDELDEFSKSGKTPERLKK